MTLHTFNRAPVQSLRIVKLAIQAEPYNHLVTFTVMDCPTLHNAIISRNWLHKMKAVFSTYHLLLHYLALCAVKKIREDQSAIRCCTIEIMNMIRK